MGPPREWTRKCLSSLVGSLHGPPEVSGQGFKERSISRVGCLFLTTVNMCGNRQGTCGERVWRVTGWVGEFTEAERGKVQRRGYGD